MKIRAKYHNALAEIMTSLLLFWMEGKSFGEALEGLDCRTDSTPVARLAVFPFLQKILASAVVGVLVENPPAIVDLTGVDLPPAELLQERGAVLCGLVGLAPKVSLFIKLHLVLGPTGLEGDERRRVRWWGFGCRELK